MNATIIIEVAINLSAIFHLKFFAGFFQYAKVVNITVRIKIPNANLGGSLNSSVEKI